MNFKKLIVAFATTLMVTTNLSAACYEPCEPCNEPCDFNVCCDPCDGWSVYADWIYWKVRDCNLQYGIPFSDNSAAATSVIEGRGYAPKTEYDSGFRIGALKECGDLNFGVHYTHYCTNASDKRQNINGDFFANTRLGYAFKDVQDRDILLAKAKYELDYNVVEVEVGYDLDLSQCFRTRAIAGFEYASIDRKFKASYFNNTDLSASALNYDVLSLSNNVDAYGVYFGSESGFTVCDCLNLFGRFTYGALVADIERTYKTNSFIGTAKQDHRANYKDECWKFVSNLNLALGVEYELQNCFCVDWTVGIGYEFHQWLCLPEFINLIITEGDSTNTHDQFFDYNDSCLSFDGLFVRVGASF